MNFKLKIAGVMAGLIGIVALTSAISGNNVPLEVGNQAPELAAYNTLGERVSMTDLKGKEIIVNFWSLKDAESRISNIRLAREAERRGAQYFGICVDSDHELAQEIIKADELPAQNQFFANKQIKEEYLQDGALKTVEINPYGIVAKID